MSFAKRGEGGTHVRTACAAATGTRRYLCHAKGAQRGRHVASGGKLHVATKLTAKCEYVFVILGDSNQRRGEGRGLRMRRQASSYALIESANFKGICEISSTP